MPTSKPRFDYTAIGFITFDCLGRKISAIPPEAEIHFIEEITLAVSGAAGAAAIAAAKYGLAVQAVGGVGEDDMGDWVLNRLSRYDVDVSLMQRIHGVGTSSSIVAVRANAQRPALHMKGATGAFEITEAMMDQVLDSAIVHVGGAGLMDKMDGEPTIDLLRRAQALGRTTTLDVAAASREDMPKVASLLPHTDYFLPSIDEGRALSGLHDLKDVAGYFLDHGLRCLVLTLGEEGAYYHHADGTRFHIPAFEVDVVCTCGCGDVFNAGFATGLVRGLDPEASVRLAQATSALNATELGSQGGVRNLAHTQAFMQATPVRSSRFAA